MDQPLVGFFVIRDLSVFVVGGVLGLLEGLQQAVEVAGAAPCEPDGRDDADEQAERQRVVDPDVGPGGLRPAPCRLEVPDGLHQEEEEVVERPDDDAPCQNTVAFGIFRRDAEEALPVEFLLFGGFNDALVGFLVHEVLEVVFAAVEELVEIVGLLAGQPGDDDVSDDGGDHAEQIDFLSRDGELAGELLRRDLPVDDGELVAEIGEGEAEVLEEVREVGGEPVVDIDPFLVDAEAEDGEDESDDHGREGAGRRSLAGIEAAEHAGARAAEVDGAREGEELEDVVALAEVVAEPPGENGDEGDGEAEQAELRLLGDGLVVDGEDDVLDENRAPAVEVGGVRGDHEEDHEGHEGAGDADGQDVAQGDWHEHLVADGFTRGEGLLQLLRRGIVFRRLVFGKGLDVAFRHAFGKRELLLHHFMDFLVDGGRLGGVVG